jgi:WD40 repeat protein
VLLQPQRVLWGHTARLWDCAFDGGGAFLATVSEDCSARLYCIATGQLLCTVQVGVLVFSI